MKSAHGLPSSAGKRPSVKLTPDLVKGFKLPNGKTDYTFFDRDVKGFGVRLREGGSRTFVFTYKYGFEARRMVLGATSAITLGVARKAAADLYAKVRLGADPAREKADAKQAATETFKAAMDVYLAHQRQELRPRSYPDVERHLLKHAQTLHSLPLSKITRRDIAACLASLKLDSHRSASGSVTYNRVRTSLSGLFSWAMTLGLVDTNPVLGTAKKRERSRERVLGPEELRAIWNALGDDDFGAIVKLLMLTGQRAGEISGLRWSEVHDDMIVLPGDRTKNHRAHVVPLSAAAHAIIERQLCRNNRELIFGRGEKPFSGWSNCKERLDARIAEASGEPLTHWVLHDARRSFATHAGTIGIQPHIVEAVLNHVSGHKAGVAGVYNRATYEPEKRTALERWAEHLTAIVEGRTSNIVPLRQA